MTENLCLKAGCRYNPVKKVYPSCCHDLAFNNFSNVKEILQIFPNAKYYSGLGPRPTNNGFHFTERSPFDDGRGPFNGYLEGPCTNLNKKGGCKFTIHPRACLNALRGEHLCTYNRQKDGLPPVDPKFHQDGN